MTSSMAGKTVDMVNHEIHRFLHQQRKVNEEFPDMLKSAAEALKNKSYNIAAKYLKNVLDSKSKERKLDKTDEKHNVLIRYMLCACWLESTDAKDLLDALQMLEELEREYNTSYPMLYYAIAKANFKLYRFAKADEILKKGNTLLANDALTFVPYFIPGSDEVIPESLRKGFMVALTSLSEQCFAWHRPNAVCCWAECSNTSYMEGVDKNIFFGCPTFNGMIQVTCNHPSNPCVMSFHVACWKAKKESLALPKKISPKELGHLNCFTPNCVDDKGERTMLKKIEIFNDQASVKSTIEARIDDSLKHTKVLPTSKGAIKKQQQQPKLKVSNENRPPLVRIPRPPVQKEVPKVDGTEEEDELNEEQALTAAIGKLNELRGKSFGLNGDKIWRPNLPMYGSEYMLATADLLDDPNFSTDTDEDEEKSFIFSYMFALISNNGPMKMDRLEEKWKEVQEDVIEKNCEYILDRHVDIAEFLTQSLKFATIGNYICTTEKLPEAYALAKKDVSEMLTFFTDNDQDQLSTASSLDDEAVFNDIINHEKNNGAVVHPTIPESATKILDEEPHGISDESSVPFEEVQNTFTNGLAEAKSIPEPEKCSEPLTFLDQASVGNVHPPEIPEIKPMPNGNIATEKKPGILETLLKVAKSDSPVERNMHKRFDASIIPTSTTVVTSLKNADIEVQKRPSTEHIHLSKDSDSPKNVIKGAYSVGDIEYELKFRQSTLNLDKLARETKSTNDLKNHISLLDDARKISMDNDVNLDKRPQARKPPATATPVENTEASESAAPEPNVHSGYTDNRKLIAEMEELREKLEQSRKETEELKLEIARLKEEHKTSRGQLLQRNLLAQYDYNKSIITAKLNEWRNNYKLVLDVQRMVNLHTGQTLRINESEMLRIVATVEEMAANLETKFATLLEELSTSVKNGNPQEVNLPPEKMTKLPNCDVVELLTSAFEIYRTQHLEQLQKLQATQRPPLFMPPQYGPIPYHYPNLQNNYLGLHGPIPQPNFMYFPDAQPTRPRRQLARPDLQPSPIIPQPLFNGQQQSIQHAPNMQAHPVYGLPTAAQNDPTFTANEAKNLSKADKSNLPFAKTMQPSLLNSDRFNAQFSDRARADSSERTIVKSNSEQDMKSTLRQLESIKIAATQSTGTPAPTTSNVRETADKNYVADCNPQTSTSHVNDGKLQSKSDTQPIENAAATDLKTMQDCDCKITTSIPTEIRSYRPPGRSLDRLMHRLRSRYTGVLELDLLKSVECVRKQRKSLSQVPMLQIIRDVDKYIEAFQQKQLCGYVKPQLHSTIPSRSSTPSRVSESERGPQHAVWSSPSTTSTRRELPATMRSKKQWEPVGIPNDTWTNTGESECMICLETMENTESYTLQCKHSFHRKCIQDWYKHQASSEFVMGSCPLCRLHSTIDNEYPPLPLG